MKAFEVRSAHTSGLTLVDHAPPSLRDDEVLVKMTAASLNFRDLANIESGRSPLGLIPLSDGCGEVVETGSRVTEFTAGDRVATCFFQNWADGRPDQAARESSLGGPLDGTLRHYATFPERGLVRAPDTLGDTEVAALPCAAVTAWRALTEGRRVGEGDVVVVQGTGGVSIFSLQFAKALGATVIATSSSDRKLEIASRLGADHLVNYRSRPDWSAEVLQITDGRGADLIVEVGGGETLGHSLTAARIDGRIVVIGVLGGAQSQSVPIGQVMGANLTIRGITVGSRATTLEFFSWLQAHPVRPVIERTLPFDQARDAFELLRSQSHVGKICLDFAL